MTRDEQRRKAAGFLALHEAPPLLILPNAWDVASARLFEIEGFRAVGTTSAGIAATLGYPDGQVMNLEENADVVRRITRNIAAPVSADMEAGYRDTTEGIVESARIFLDAGVAGLNIEDSTGDADAPLFDISLMQERIGAIREMAASEGIPLVLNVRTDVYLCLCAGKGPEACLRETVSRGNAYRQAGADCVFVPTWLDEPGFLDRETIVCLVSELDAPLNLLGGAVTLPIAELEQIGVARVSVGPGPMRAALGLIREISRELLEKGTCTGMTAKAIPYSEVNHWFDRGRSV
jgi:2-methylisocitrate lyase-like PEP mutase family enzyme